MSHKKIKFGAIGCGYITQKAHLPAIKRIRESKLIATASASEKRAKDVATEYGAKAHYTDYNHLLEREDVDAVIIGAPNSLHHEITVAAAESGKHVLCEKPIACTNKEAEDMVKACRKAQVKLQIGHNQRFWTVNELAKSYVEKKIIGEIKACRSTWRESWGGYADKIALTKFRYDKTKSGAFAIMDTGIHKVDLIRWFVGEIKKVFGIAKSTALPPHLSHLDDNDWILCQFENEAYGCISVDKFSPGSNESTELYGIEGSIFLSTESSNPFQAAPMILYSEKQIEDLPNTVSKYSLFPFWEKPEKGWIPLFPPREDPFYRQMRHFVNCILHDQKPMVDGEEGAKSLEVILAMFKSMEIETWVDLPLKEEVIPFGYRHTS